MDPTQQVLAAGVTQDFLNQQKALGKGGTFNGSNLDPQDVSRTISAFQSQQLGQNMSNVQGQLANLTSQNYQFDPNAYLPQIQNTANSIYTPQQAQLEAIRQLQNASAKDTKIQTEKDFAKRLQSEQESINRRGAFFSGGAIQNEQDIRTQKQSQLFQQGLQASAADFSNQASQAQLAAEKTQFIQDRLVNADSSAYARWTDQRNFSFQALQTQYTNMVNERNYVRSVFESDRTYGMEVKKMDMQQKQFEQTYKITAEQFKQANKQFDLDMKVKNLSYTQALDKFKKSTAVSNSGIFGVDENGNDVLDTYWKDYSSQQSRNPVPEAFAPFNIDNWIKGQ
jgi:superfamily II DNA helicase RecQ